MGNQPYLLVYLAIFHVFSPRAGICIPLTAPWVEAGIGFLEGGKRKRGGGEGEGIERR